MMIIQKKDSEIFEEFFLDYFSPKIISNEIVEYLIELIQNDKAVSVKEELVDRLKKVFSYASKHDFLYKYDSGEIYSNPPLTKSINTFYGLWILTISVINDLAGFNREKTNIIDDYKPIISDFIILLRRNFPNAYLSLNFQNFSGADLIGADLSGADLSEADLSGAYLIGAYLRRADLRRADLRRADLRRANLIEAYLIEAYLSGAYLIGADLSRADFREAYLIGADLSGAYLIGADLSRADLRGADLRRADLSRADLRGADLSGANLRRAGLSGANLSDADLSGADLSDADLSDADLSGVKGLDKASNLETANFKGTIFEGKINQRADGSYWIEGYSKGEL